MSELSEAAASAGWLENLEYGLWQAVVSGPGKYWRLHITAEQIARLRDLSDSCGGWIIFDDRLEESFVPKQQWEQMFLQRSRDSADS